MSEYINLAVPFFSQRENIYVWQQRYEKDKIDNITGKKTDEYRWDWCWWCINL